MNPSYALRGDDRLALSFYNQALAVDAFDLFSRELIHSAG
jgi:hypothetical protein